MAELGSDISGVDDLDATLSVVTGKRALAQAILRRLTTPLGMLIDDPTYGLDVRSFIGDPVYPDNIKQEIVKQLDQEEEVLRASVAVVFDARTSLLQIQINVVAGDGPFELTISVNELALTAFFDGDIFVELPQAA